MCHDAVIISQFQTEKSNVMKMRRILLIMTALLALAACRKEPDMTETDGKYLVYTSYDADTDFSAYSTFIVADSMFVMNSGNSGYVSEDDDSEVREILDAYRDEMTALGYTEVQTKADADLGIQVSYLEQMHQSVDFVPGPYWWWDYPGYWSPGWWGGYYGGWAPYSYPVSYSWSTHSFLTEMVDLTPLTGDEEADSEVRLSVVWNSYLDGSLVSGYRIMDNLKESIGQSFAQSPQLAK